MLEKKKIVDKKINKKNHWSKHQCNNNNKKDKILVIKFDKLPAKYVFSCLAL